MSEPRENEPTREQAAAFELSRTDRDRTLDAVHALEEALGGAAPGREADWLKQVVVSFDSLAKALSREITESSRPDSLLSMIGRDYPRRFGSRVRQLREQYNDIQGQVTSLHAQLEAASKDPIDFSDLRQRVAWLMRALHHRRARETDLVFEAINLDLGRPEGGPNHTDA